MAHNKDDKTSDKTSELVAQDDKTSDKTSSPVGSASSSGTDEKKDDLSLAAREATRRAGNTPRGVVDIPRRG
jgi:hypothetical protein